MSGFFAGADDGTVLHYDGVAWSPVRLDTVVPVMGIAGAPGHRVLFSAWVETAANTLLELFYPFGNELSCPPGDARTCSSSDLLYLPRTNSSRQ